MIEYRIAVAAAMLILASYFDLKSREIDDRLWEGFAFIGVALYVYEFFTAGIIYDWLLTVVVVGATAGFAFLLYRLGFYGGADALALISLSIILPLYSPSIYALPTYRNPVFVLFYPVTAVMVLANAAVCVMVFPITLFFRNLLQLFRGKRIFTGFEVEPRWKKAAVMFLGYRMKETGEGGFHLPLEKVVEGKRMFDFRMFKEDDEFLRGNDVWGTPGIPFLLFMTFGFIAMLLLGDILTFLMESLLIPLAP
jgi:preflagellin peptidase FlaK